MPDLAAALSTAATVFAGLLSTSGTTVTLTRPAADVLAGAVSTTTRSITAPTETTLYTAVAGLVVPASSLAVTDLPQGVPLADGEHVVFLLPAVVDLAAGDRVTVVTARDADLVGRSMLVRYAEASSAGVVRRLVCTRPGAYRSASA